VASRLVYGASYCDDVGDKTAIRQAFLSTQPLSPAAALAAGPLSCRSERSTSSNHGGGGGELAASHDQGLYST
jgi:hypothetical protein